MTLNIYLCEEEDCVLLSGRTGELCTCQRDSISSFSRHLTTEHVKQIKSRSLQVSIRSINMSAPTELCGGGVYLSSQVVLLQPLTFYNKVRTVKWAGQTF